jgi:hypothetical protein
MNKLLLFDFELFHPSNIRPWLGSDGNDPHLSYHHLSQAHLCFNVGNQKLLEYSPEILAHWKKLSAADGHVFEKCPPLADQMMSRVHLDLTDGLHRFLDPIPDDMQWWMMPQRNEPGSRWGTLCSRVWSDDASTVNCSLLVNTVRDAFCGRLLYGWDCLVQEPRISIWSNETEVFVSWDNRDRLVDGIPVWTASLGIQAFGRDEFLAEMHDFRYRYFDAMARQLALVRAGALKTNIRTDVDYDEKCLLEDKAIPLSKYVEAQTEHEPTDWEAVRVALQQTLKLTGLELS